MRMIIHAFGMAAVLVGSVLAGCGSDDGSNAGADTSMTPPGEELFRGSHDWRWRHTTTTAGAGGATSSGSSTTSTGGAAGTGGASGSSAATCDVCTKAHDCCVAVSSGPCNESAQTCSTVDPASRGPYINECLTFLSVVSCAWSGNPPAVCR